MARFDLYANPNGKGLLLDLQSDLLDGMTTRVVAPLIPRPHAPMPAMRLNPVFEVDGTEHVLITQLMAAVPSSLLKTKVGTVAHEADAITAALDMVFQGF